MEVAHLSQKRELDRSIALHCPKRFLVTLSIRSSPSRTTRPLVLAASFLIMSRK